MNTEPDQSITVLPLGAWEQHGPHLPLQTDTIIASEFAARLEKHAFAVNINILPTEPIGYSVEHMDFEGSRSLSYDEAISKWLSIIEEQVNLGHRKILLLNAHGGNSPFSPLSRQKPELSGMRWLLSPTGPDLVFLSIYDQPLINPSIFTQAILKPQSCWPSPRIWSIERKFKITHRNKASISTTSNTCAPMGSMHSDGR